MSIGNVSRNLRGLTVGALALGVLGAACFWWVPIGMILSFAGLMTGIFDAAVARRRSLDWQLSLAAVFVSFAALMLTITVALLDPNIVSLRGI